MCDARSDYVEKFCYTYKVSHPLECNEETYGTKRVRARLYYECIKELKDDLNTLDVKARWYLVIATLLYGLFFNALAKYGWSDKSLFETFLAVLFLSSNFMGIMFCMLINRVYFVETELLDPENLVTAAENYYETRQDRGSLLYCSTISIGLSFVFFTLLAFSPYFPQGG